MTFPNNPGSSGINLYDANGVAVASAAFNPVGTSYVYNWTSSNSNPVRSFEIRQSTTNRIVGVWDSRFYGPKTAGAWGAGAPLRGGQGSSGVAAATSPLTYSSATQTVGINQTQLAINLTQVTQSLFTLTGSHTTTNANRNAILRSTSATPITITIPATIAVGERFDVVQSGAGQITFAAGAGATLSSRDNKLKIAGQHGAATVLCVASGQFTIIGDLVA